MLKSEIPPTSEEAVLETGDEGRSDRAERLKRVRLDRIREGYVGSVIKVLLSDPNTYLSFRHLFKDTNVLTNDAFDPKDPEQKVTPLVLAIMRDPSMREVFVDFVLMNMRFRSDDLKRSLERLVPDMDRGKFDSPEVQSAAVYNKVIVGAGVQGSVFNSAYSFFDPNSKILTVEASRTVSANFYTKGFMSVNTSNMPHEAKLPDQHLRRGNSHYFGKHAPVQIPYIEPQKFPSANTLAEASVVNQYLSTSGNLMETSVVRVIDKENAADQGIKGFEKWPANFKVIFSDGTYVFADMVFFASGLGEEILPKQFDKESLAIIAEESGQRVENGHILPPGIMTYNGFAQFLADSEEPLRHFAGKTVDLVGGGDGAATVAEALLRYTRRETYRRDVAQVGVPAVLHWGGQGLKNSTDYKRFLQNLRYLLLALDMPLSEDDPEYDPEEREAIHTPIDPIDGHLVQIRRNEDTTKPGKFRLTYALKKDGTVKEVYSDYVILATGFKSNIGSVLGYEDENPFDDPNEAEVVKAEFPEKEAKLPVAVKLKGRGIYAMGPAANTKVFMQEEMGLTGFVGEKPKLSVAIATHAPRVEALAKLLAESDRETDKVLPGFEPERVPDVITITESRSGKRKKERPAQIRTVMASPESLRTVGLHDVRIKATLGALLERCVIVGGDKAGALTIEIASDPKNHYAAQVSIPGNVENADVIFKALQDEQLAPCLVAAVFGKRWKAKINIPFNKKGGPIIQSISITRELIRQRGESDAKE